MTPKTAGIDSRWHLPREEDSDQRLHRVRLYARPGDVVTDDLLTLDQRRAVLACWASDACAVESHPSLRHPPFAEAPVGIDEIMAALSRLDRMAKSPMALNDKRFARFAVGSRHAQQNAFSHAM